jgi:hypothetical protein
MLQKQGSLKSAPTSTPCTPRGGNIDVDEALEMLDRNANPNVPEEEEADILFESESVEGSTIRKVRAASLPKLIERLTYEKYPGKPFFIFLFHISYSN